MYFQIFSNFKVPERLTLGIPIIVSERVIHKTENEKKVLETTVKLFYKARETTFSVINCMLENGFRIFDKDPFTIITSTRPKYKRKLIKTLTPEEYLLSRQEYVNSDIVYCPDSKVFELYEKCQDGIEKIEIKHYYNDRIIFELI